MILAVGNEVVKIPHLHKHDGKLWAECKRTFLVPQDLGFKLETNCNYRKIPVGKNILECFEFFIKKL